MGLLSWIKGLGSSEKNKEQIYISEEQKDIDQMNKELQQLKNRKFRITRIEYKHNDKNDIFYYAQTYGKRKWVDGFTAEYNNNEWWSLCIGNGYNIYINPYMGGGSGCIDEDGALKLIDDFKKQAEESIRKSPERKKFLRDYDKRQSEKRKQKIAEYENSINITHKYIQ